MRKVGTFGDIREQRQEAQVKPRASCVVYARRANFKTIDEIDADAALDLRLSTIDPNPSDVFRIRLNDHGDRATYVVEQHADRRPKLDRATHSASEMWRDLEWKGKNGARPVPRFGCVVPGSVSSS